LTLHSEGYGFTLTFFFVPKNSYFLEEVLEKRFVMSRANCIDKAEGTKINWKEGCDPTVKKVKKKRKGKKVTVEVPQKSFFSFFDMIRMPSDEQLQQGILRVQREDLEKDEDLIDEEQTKQPEGEEKELDTKPNPEEDDIGERLDRDYQLGLDFKDELIPLAYEYYLNVIEHEIEEESDEELEEESGKK